MEASQRLEMNLDLEELKSWKEQSIVGLTIRAEYEAGRDLLIDGAIKPSAKVNPDVIPTLILETEKPKKRNRRQGDMYCPAGSNEKGCCLRDMKVRERKRETEVQRDRQLERREIERQTVRERERD